MTSDIEAIECISSLANGKTIGGELGFTYPEVLEAIRLSTVSSIAVLGVEIFRVTGQGYETITMSGYDLTMSGYDLPDQDWSHYVMANNALAEEFIKANPTGDQHIYVLTTSSLREFRRITEERRV
jgi:hypothetical protein